jgi:hypothetical protein
MGASGPNGGMKRFNNHVRSQVGCTKARSLDRAFAFIGGGAGIHIDTYLIEYKRFIIIFFCLYPQIYP